jgi:hypothetical protein
MISTQGSELLANCNRWQQRRTSKKKAVPGPGQLTHRTSPECTQRCMDLEVGLWQQRTRSLVHASKPWQPPSSSALQSTTENSTAVAQPHTCQTLVPKLGDHQSKQGSKGAEEAGSWLAEGSEPTRQEPTSVESKASSHTVELTWSVARFCCVYVVDTSCRHVYEMPRNTQTCLERCNATDDELPCEPG